MNGNDIMESHKQSPVTAIDISPSGDRGRICTIQDHDNRQVRCEICGQRTRFKDLATHKRRTKCGDLRMKHDFIRAVWSMESAAHQHQHHLDHQHDQLDQQFYRAALSRARRTNTPVRHKSQLSAAQYCKNCKKPFHAGQNISNSCHWHLGPIVNLFGGSCSSCGRLDYQNGCMVGKHEL